MTQGIKRPYTLTKKDTIELDGQVVYNFTHYQVSDRAMKDVLELVNNAYELGHMEGYEKGFQSGEDTEQLISLIEGGL